MKKMVLIVLAVITATFIGCGSAPQTSQNSVLVSSTASPPTKAAPRTVDYIITDWQGGSLGRPIPEWVDFVADKNKGALAKVSGLEGKEIYLYTEEGADLDLIRANTQINGFAQISMQIKTAIAFDAGNRLSGSKNALDSKRQAVETTAGIVSQNVISGFTLDRDFWQKKRYKDSGKEAIEYYAIFVIGAEDLKHQLDLALGKIEAKTREEQEAKEAIHGAIKDAKSLLSE
jgi:hypothetical protein